MAAGRALQLQSTVVPGIPRSSPTPMETPPSLQVHDLGLVAGVLDRIRLVESVDRLVGPRPGEKVSTGMALKAAILNVLGEWALRRRLDETGSSLPDQRGRPTQRPTPRWVFQLYLGAPGLAGRPTPGPQPGPPSRDRGAPAGGKAILPPGVRGCGMWGVNRGSRYPRLVGGFSRAAAVL